MSEMEKSGYTFYSVGIVAEHKARGSFQIKANAVEINSMGNGDINAKTDINTTSPDATGVSRKSASVSSRTLDATWLPFSDPNRMTAPDVRAGETVMLWRYADTQQCFWSTMMVESGLRRLEHVVYAYCNIPDGTAPLSENTSYWAKWSTADKLVQFHTSDNNGEAAAYDIVIDGAAGQLVVRDNAGNEIILDSPSGTLQVTTTSKVEVISPKVLVTSPDSEFTGNVKVGGALTVNQGIKMGTGGGAAMEMNGPIVHTGGSLTTAGDVISSGKGIFPGGVEAPNV